ncbi:MAG TPA: hypothetical protein VG076_00995 [Acidimicrobiales bacterium]|jgi:hypothetical protein|nr:hypothetical protein [Acidimicrobiales bacterium]
MATASGPEPLTPEQEERRRAYEASFEAQRRAARNPDLMKQLRKRLADLTAKYSRRSI